MQQASKKLIFSSKHGAHDSNTPTDFLINFQNSEISRGAILGIMAVDVVIPNFFYNVTSSNNINVINDGVTDITIVMPVGHYTVDEFMGEFAAQLAATASAVTVDSFSINPVTGQLTITMTGEWDWVSTTSNSVILLGTGYDDLSSTSSAITFPNILHFNGPQVVLLEINNTSASNSVIGYENQQRTILDFICLSDTCYGKYHHHFIRDEASRSLTFTSKTDMRDFRIRLLDENGELLELPPNVSTVIDRKSVV